jgi:hypothetical protein
MPPSRMPCHCSHEAVCVRIESQAWFPPLEALSSAGGSEQQMDVAVSRQSQAHVP